MTSPTIPTSLRGRASQFDYGFNAVLDELTTDLPADLVWPLSVPLYASMSREAHLSSINRAYVLQLRRGQWQLDGRGCRPAVVRLVADDMGLLVAGEDDPGGARTRGVSWHEHLRAALMSLTYGHSAFEMQADTSSGQARLVTLAERMPWTISEIHVDPTSGDLLGISQDQARLARDRTPQITADRLVFYVHERVGPNWAGTSLLRASYAPWLIKREMIRVNAIAHRRWAAGVPVMEALPGTNPTDGQMERAQAMASAARGGDQAGAATPPGFTMKILGLSGALPDTLAFLDFLNREMSRAALMGHIELGMGDSGGSRALGTALIDSWTLALETVAEGVADTATRQIAARIVQWNFGDDEPVPRVVVSGIGSRREVTAESLGLLLGSGALAADPALEAWIRREYRLPEREMPLPAVAPSTPTVAASARKRAPRRPKEPAQLALPIRVAAAAAPDFNQIQQQWEAAKADLLAQWPQAAEPMVDDLTAQAQAAVEAEDLGALGTLVVTAAAVTVLAALIGDAGVGVALQAAAGVVDEAAAQAVEIAAPAGAGEDRARAAADAIAGMIASGYASGAARAALQAGTDPAAVAAAVRAHLDELGTSEAGFVADHLGAAMTSAQHAGRAAALQEAPPARYIAREHNDTSRCKPCSEIDGTEFDNLADALAAYPGGGYSGCLGGLRCRGIAAPIWD